MNPFRHYRAVWPILDATRTHTQHVTEAAPDLTALLTQGRLQPHGDIRWRVMPGRLVAGSRGAATVLVADVCVEQLPRPATERTQEPRPQHARLAWLEDIEHLAATGHTLTDVAHRTRVQPDSVRVRLHRAHRDDLTAALTRNETTRNAA